MPTTLWQALSSGDECVRWGAACALAQRSAGEALPHLLDALRRAPLPLLEPVVVAMDSLGLQATEALPLLRELLGRPKLPFAESVACALLAHSADQAEEVVQRLRDPKPLVRRRILLGVASNVTQDERGRHAVVLALLDPDLGVRRAAGAYCSRFVFLSSRDEAVLGPLRQALGDTDPQVRAGAANALRHLTRSARSAEPDLLALLRQDPDAEVRRSAARSLTTLEYETQAIFAGLEAGLDDPEEEVQRICAWGLCHWESMTADRVRRVLRRLSQVDKGLTEYLAFAVCHSQVALPEVVTFLHNTLRKKGGTLRSAAAVSLGRLKVDDAAVLADLFAFLGKIAEDGRRDRGDASEVPPALERAARNQRQDLAEAIMAALRRLIRDLDAPGKATNLAILKRKLSNAHKLADCRSEAHYRSMITLAENALAAVPWTEIDAGLLNLLQEQLQLGLENRPVTTDDYLQTSRTLGDNRHPLGPTFEQADEQDYPIEEEPADEVLH